jgi:hypothetical protein
MATDGSPGETDRVTIAVALAATYLAVVLNLDSIIGKDATGFLYIMKLILLLHFAGVSMLWVLYLLYKGRSLRFYENIVKTRASDVTVCFVYLFAKAAKKKEVLEKSKDEKELWFNDRSRAIHTFFFDEALSQCFLLPGLLACILVPRFAAMLLERGLGWAHQTALIASVIAFLLVSLLASLAANVGRFLITGKQ